MKPDEYRVIEVPYRPIEVPKFDDAEARERWEMERWRAREHEAFPGFSPAGGFIGLVRQETRRGDDEGPTDDDDDRVRESMLDFYFYGPQRSGESYGRLGKGFGFQRPTPNHANSGSTLK